MHSKSDHIKFTTDNDPNEVVDKFIELLRSRYQSNLETSMEGSEFVSVSIQVIYYQCHRVNFRRGGSYIIPPDWIKKRNKKFEK